MKKFWTQLTVNALVKLALVIIIWATGLLAHALYPSIPVVSLSFLALLGLVLALSMVYRKGLEYWLINKLAKDNHLSFDAVAKVFYARGVGLTGLRQHFPPVTENKKEKE